MPLLEMNELGEVVTIGFDDGGELGQSPADLSAAMAKKRAAGTAGTATNVAAQKLKAAFDAKLAATKTASAIPAVPAVPGVSSAIPATPAKKVEEGASTASILITNGTALQAAAPVAAAPVTQAEVGVKLSSILPEVPEEEEEASTAAVTVAPSGGPVAAPAAVSAAPSVIFNFRHPMEIQGLTSGEQLKTLVAAKVAALKAA